MVSAEIALRAVRAQRYRGRGTGDASRLTRNGVPRAALRESSAIAAAAAVGDFTRQSLEPELWHCDALRVCRYR